MSEHMLRGQVFRIVLGIAIESAIQFEGQGSMQTPDLVVFLQFCTSEHVDEGGSQC